MKSKLLNLRTKLQQHFSVAGLLMGTLFFAFSLSPTLLPRTNLIQGLISGSTLAAGYGVGVFIIWIWKYLELPRPKPEAGRILKWVAGVLCLITALFFLWQANTWQNSLRDLMGMEVAPQIQPLIIGLVALVLFLILLFLARLFRWTYQSLQEKLQRFIPRKISFMLGLMAAFFLFWSLLDGLFSSVILRVADRTYERVDSVMDPEFDRPEDPMRTGSHVSLLDWEDMGRQGRQFLSMVPSIQDLRDHSRGQVTEPIRVYVGMHAAETYEERAELALGELIRLNAFERSVLILITPTGTGWVDPAAIEPMEFLFRGDVASVAAQYSYLPSALSLLMEDEYGTEMARALFQKIYEYWTELPKESRPKLYLQGLSLGALNSDRSFDLYDIINDPFDGVLWSGPPFRKSTWRTITDQRNPGSPEWLPRFRDGSVVRFANQFGGLEQGETPWGSFRIAYLQYASDPITFFDPQAFTREPEWMTEPRGPDVSANLRWVPIVTMFQLAADMIAGTAPVGFGHEYAPTDYLDSWFLLAEPPNWSEEEFERLRLYFLEEFPGKISN